MSVIGVYDSGIGGLTTLATLEKALSGYEFFYLADNKNMPFGVKPQDVIYKTVTDGLKILNEHSDVQVIACNTASTVVCPKGAYLLRPEVQGYAPNETLVLSTPATAKALNLNEKKYLTADTKNLASLIEIMGSISFKSRQELKVKILENEVDRMFEVFKENKDKISTVFLGCSHYVYIKSLVKKHFKNAEIIDGNLALKMDIIKDLPPLKNSGKITFKFTGENEEMKYRYILSELKRNQRFYGI